MNLREIIRDLTRRYSNSFVHVEAPSGEESLFFVDSITEDADKGARIQLSSPEVGKITINLGSAHTLKFKYPPVGVFQHGKDAFLFRRRPERQYTHGLCDGNSDLRLVLGQYARHPDAGLSFEKLISAFNPECYRYGDAVRMLQSGKYRSVALHRNFTLSLSITAAEGYTLMYWDQPIASTDKDGEISVMYDKSFTVAVAQLKE